MVISFGDEIIRACNDAGHRMADMKLAKRIRTFRHYPVRHVSDEQLAEIVRISREHARSLGIKSDHNVARFVGHVDKWRIHRRIEVMSMKPRKLWAVLS